MKSIITLSNNSQECTSLPWVFKPCWVIGIYYWSSSQSEYASLLSIPTIQHSFLVIMSQLIGLMSKLVMQHCHTLMVELEVIQPTANSESKQFQIPMEFNVRRVTSAAVRSVRFCIINRVQLAWTPVARPRRPAQTGHQHQHAVAAPLWWKQLDMQSCSVTAIIFTLNQINLFILHQLPPMTCNDCYN